MAIFTVVTWEILDKQNILRKIKGDVSLWLEEYSAMTLLIKYQVMKTFGGSGGKTPRIMELDTTCRRVVSFTPRLIHHRRTSPRFPLDWTLGGSQFRFRLSA